MVVHVGGHSVQHSAAGQAPDVTAAIFRFRPISPRRWSRSIRVTCEKSTGIQTPTSGSIILQPGPA